MKTKFSDLLLCRIFVAVCVIIFFMIQMLMLLPLTVTQTREDRKRRIITTLMHEFGHALEAHMKLPDCEAAIEAACQAWETQYAKQANSVGMSPKPKS